MFLFCQVFGCLRPLAAYMGQVYLLWYRPFPSSGGGGKFPRSRLLNQHTHQIVTPPYFSLCPFFLPFSENIPFCQNIQASRIWTNAKMHEFDIAKDPLGIIYGGKLCEMGLNIARARGYWVRLRKGSPNAWFWCKSRPLLNSDNYLLG